MNGEFKAIVGSDFETVIAAGLSLPFVGAV